MPRLKLFRFILIAWLSLVGTAASGEQEYLLGKLGAVDIQFMPQQRKVISQGFVAKPKPEPNELDNVLQMQADSIAAVVPKASIASGEDTAPWQAA